MLRRILASTAVLVLAGTGTAVGAPQASGDYVCGSTEACVHVTWHGPHVSNGHFDFDHDLLDQQIDQPTSQSYPNCDETRCYLDTTSGPGVTVRALILSLRDLAGVGFGPEAVESATVKASTGGHEATLRRDAGDLAEFGQSTWQPYSQQDLLPVIWGDGGSAGRYGGVYYARPRHSDSDANAADNTVGTLDNGILNVDLYVADVPLTPTAHASSLHVDVGQSVRFTTTWEHDPPAATQYSWDFGDGRSATGASVRHTFIKGGPFLVQESVSAAGPPPASGVSNQLSIQVADSAPPKRGHEPAPGAGAGSRSNPLHGPVRGTGLRAGGRPDAPSSGPIGPSSGIDATNAAGASSAASAKSASKTASPRGADGLVAVNGLLLDPAVVAAAPSAQHRSGRPETAPSARRGVIASATPVFGIVLGAAILVLLILGVLGESRRPARAPRRRSGT